MPRYYEGRSDVPPIGRMDVVTPQGTAGLAGREFVDGLAPGELEQLRKQKRRRKRAEREQAEQRLSLSDAMRVRVDTAELRRSHRGRHEPVGSWREERVDDERRPVAT